MMRWINLTVTAIALGVAACLAADVAHAEEAPRPLTLADCPPGYVLGVEDTAEPQLPMRDPDAIASNPTDQNAAAAQQAAAPRQFVTGCVLPRQQQLRQVVQPGEDFHEQSDYAQ
jgi:hypothetical protein